MRERERDCSRRGEKDNSFCHIRVMEVYNHVHMVRAAGKHGTTTVSLMCHRPTLYILVD